MSVTNSAILLGGVLLLIGGVVLIGILGSGQTSTQTRESPQISAVRGYDELTNGVKDKFHNLVDKMEQQGHFSRDIVDNRVEFVDREGVKQAEIEVSEGALKPKYRSSDGTIVEFLASADIDGISAYSGDNAYDKMVSEDIEAKIG